MNRQTLKQFTIKEYAVHSGLSDATIRRKLKAGQLFGERVNGRWMIAVAVDDKADAQSTPRHESADAQSIEQSPLVQQLQSENSHLRRQVEHLTTVVAMQTSQQGELVKQLERPKPAGSAAWDWVRLKLQALSTNGLR